MEPQRRSVRHPLTVCTVPFCSLDTAVDLVVKCSRVRVPEPIRAADKKSREFIRQLLASGQFQPSAEPSAAAAAAVGAVDDADSDDAAADIVEGVDHQFARSDLG